MLLSDGRTLCIEIPGRYMTTDRGGETALLPEAVRLVDRAIALTTSLNTPGRPPSPGFIVTLREALGLTQGEFGARIGVDKMTVYRWERGMVRPGGESLAAMEKLRTEAARKGLAITGDKGR